MRLWKQVKKKIIEAWNKPSKKNNPPKDSKSFTENKLYLI